MTERNAGGALPRVGLVCIDPLRILGLQVLLRDGIVFRVAVLEGTRAADLADLELIVIDATATGHLRLLIEAFRRIRPQVRLLVLGDETDETYTEGVIGAGAQGYLAHSTSEAELHRAVAVVRDGSMWAPRKVLARLLERARAGVEQAPSGAADTPTLTKREIEVLRLLVLGRSNREIAGSLNVHETTIKSHLGRLMRKAGVRNRTELTMRSLAERWTS